MQEPVAWMLRVDVNVNALPTAKDFVAELAEVVPAVAVHVGFARTAQAHTWAICTRRAGKLCKARSRLYRSQILQVNTKY